VSRLWLKLAVAAVFLIAWTQSSALQPRRESGVFQIDPPTPYFHYLPDNTPRGRVLVIHGLDVSKEVMHFISAALVDGGFEVYSIDLPGHGDSEVGFQTALAQHAISKVMAEIGEDTIVLGHSLGAGLLLDLAEDRHFSTMVLLAPPPMGISRIQADRTLIATGDQDVPRIRSFVPIAADVGDPHVEVWMLPWSGHSAPIRSPAHVRRVVEWIGGEGKNTKTVARIAWLGVMLVAGVALGVALMPGRPIKPLSVHVPTTLVLYVAAAGLAMLTLAFFNPVSWLRLFATDYLIGFLLLTGLALTFFGGLKQARAQPSNLLKAIAAAAFVIFVLGWLVASNALHIALSDGRWWRFPCIALASLPLFAADEFTIRRIGPSWQGFGAALITRTLLCAFVLTGILTMNRESAFLLLIAPLMLVFWIGLWVAAEIVHRHTQDPLAAAVFAALVQGWAFAAWFVTI
jgi:pimeloyl-ACP methyl ester carboxylesterase